jgi:ankyrin repeat protein
MATFGDIVQAYTLARGNRWDHTVNLLALDPFVAYDVAHFASQGSGWTFLHQAAHLGNEEVARQLVARGANRKA